MEEDRRGIRVSLISVRPVEDDGRFFDKVVFKRVALSTFAKGNSVESGISLCRLILDLDIHSPW